MTRKTLTLPGLRSAAMAPGCDNVLLPGPEFQVSRGIAYTTNPNGGSVGARGDKITVVIKSLGPDWYVTITALYRKILFFPRDIEGGRILFDEIRIDHEINIYHFFRDPECFITHLL